MDYFNIKKYININRIKDNEMVENSFFINLTLILNGILGLIFWSIIQRFYQENWIAISTLLITSMNSITVYSRLGYEISLNKYIPQNSNIQPQIINTALWSSGIITYIVSLFFIIPIINNEGSLSYSSTLVIITFFITSMIWTQELIIDTVYISLFKAKYMFIRTSFFQLVKIIFALLFINYSLGIYWGWASSILVTSIPTFYMLKKSMPSFKLRFKISLSILKKMSKISFVSYITKQNLKLYSSLMPLFIIKITSITLVTSFYLAWLTASILYVLVTSVGTLTLTKFSRDGFDIKQLKMISFIILGSSILVSILAPLGAILTFPILFPLNYKVVIRFFVILIIAIPFIGFSNLYQMILFHEGNIRIPLYMSLVSLIITFSIIILFWGNMTYMVSSWTISSIFIGIWGVFGLINIMKK